MHHQQMKNILKSWLPIIIGIFIISCSSDNENSNDQIISGNLSKWIIKEYNSDNELVSLNEYQISDNRITSLIAYNSDDSFQSILSETVYTYQNNKITRIAGFYFGSLEINDTETNFVYDSGILTEYKTKILNTDFVQKVTFENNGNNTILTKLRSTDNGQTFQPINFGPITELVFDNNDNLILTKPPGPIGSNVNYVDAIEYVYQNLNLINVSKYPSTELNYTYTNKQNPISSVFINTFGKKGFSLIYSPNNLLFWNNLSPNVLNSLSGQNIGTYSIDNDFISDTLIKMTITLDSFSDGSINSRTIHEFEYE
jgi:hypothetical protein